MLPLLLTVAWLTLMSAVVALCRAGSRADSQSAAELPRLRRGRRFGPVPGLTVWDPPEPLEATPVASRPLHGRRRRGGHQRARRRPAGCA